MFVDSTIEGHARPSVGNQSPVYERSDGHKRIVASAWVDAAVIELLDAVAETEDVTRSTLVREAIEELVAKRIGKGASSRRRGGHRPARQPEPVRRLPRSA